RGAARGARGIERVARSPGNEGGELGGNRLAQDRAARLARERNRCRVSARAVALIDRRAVLGRQVVRVKDVFHADRHAEQRAARVLKRWKFLGDAGPRLHLRLALANAPAAHVPQRLRAQLAPVDQAGRFFRTQTESIQDRLSVIAASPWPVETSSSSARVPSAPSRRWPARVS